MEMKNKIKFLIIFLTSFSFNKNLLAKELTPAQIFESVNNDVVVIYSYDFENKFLKQGSGVVINDSGFIITNFHVFSECENIVVYHNKMKLGTAEIINADMDKDILIIKLDNSDLQGIPIGNSDNLVVGEKVYAIGSPLGYENTISEGIISGIRSYDDSRLIQVTASISEGSSGGAIVNSNGELIGISTYQEKKGQNLNFAIPINEVMNFKSSFSYERNVIEGNKIFIKGYNAHEAQRYEDAVYYYTGFLKIYIDGLVYFNRGLAYLELERYTEAIKDFSNAINNNYLKAKVYYSRGKAYLERGDYLMAQSDYNYAVTIDPISAEAYNSRGEYYLRIEEFKNSLKDFTTAIKLEDTYSLYYYNRGQAYAYLKENIKAINDYTTAIEIFPNYYDAYYSRALLFNRIENYEKSISDFQKCIEMLPNYKYPYNNLGWTYFNKKDFKNAIYYLEKCYDIDKSDWDALLGIATAYYALQKMERAEKYLKKAIEVEPRLKMGMEGLIIMEKEGYSYKKSQKKIIKELFEEFN